MLIEGVQQKAYSRLAGNNSFEFTFVFAHLRMLH